MLPLVAGDEDEAYKGEGGGGFASSGRKAPICRGGSKFFGGTNEQTEIKREVKALKLRRRRADLEDESETGRRF